MLDPESVSFGTRHSALGASSPLPTDTSPEAARVQIDLLRRATPARRFELMCSLTSSVRQMARNAIQRLHPEMTERERNLLFVRIHYGAKLAGELAAHLSRK